MKGKMTIFLKNGDTYTWESISKKMFREALEKLRNDPILIIQKSENSEELAVPLPSILKISWIPTSQEA